MYHEILEITYKSSRIALSLVIKQLHKANIISTKRNNAIKRALLLQNLSFCKITIIILINNKLLTTKLLRELQTMVLRVTAGSEIVLITMEFISLLLIRKHQ